MCEKQKGEKNERGLGNDVLMKRTKPRREAAKLLGLGTELKRNVFAAANIPDMQLQSQPGLVR